MSISIVVIVVLLGGLLSLAVATVFGRAIPIENEAEERKILRSFRASSKTQIAQTIHRLSCWYISPKGRKKHRTARAA